jgi:hypothetical protein
MIFEDTSAFHKAAACETERLLLSVDYVLRRPPPPERPVTMQRAGRVGAPVSP